MKYIRIQAQSISLRHKRLWAMAGALSAVVNPAVMTSVVAQENAAVPANAAPAVDAPTINTAPTINAAASGINRAPLRTAEEIAPTGPAGAGLADERHQLAAQVAPLSLTDALVMTLRNNPERASAQAALQAARARIGTARSEGGLQVGIGGSVDYQNSYGGGGNTFSNGNGTGGFNNRNNNNFSQSAGINADIPITTGGRVGANRRAAEASARAQAAQTLEIEQQLVQSTITAYLDVLRSEQLLEVAESNLSVSRERRRVAGNRYNVGAGARLEVLSANTDLSEAQQNRITATNNLAQAKAILNTLLGRAPETPVRVLPVAALTPRVPIAMSPAIAGAPQTGAPGATASPSATTTTGTAANSEALRAIAEQANPGLATNRAQIEAALANVDVARAQRRPQVGFSLSNLLTNPVQSLGRFVFSLGLNASQTLFDSGRARSQIEEARALTEQSRQNLNSQRLAVASQIEAALLNLNSAQKRLQSADDAVIEAQEALIAAQRGYEAGARTPLEVSDAQSALLTAQTEAANSRFDVANAQAQLSTAVGVLTVEGQQAYEQALQMHMQQQRQQQPQPTRQ